MRRLKVVVVITLTIAAALAGFSPAGATSFSTDSWGCGWSGGSAGGGVTNYSWTSGADWCTLSAGVQVDYYVNGNWYSASWVGGGTYVQDNEVGSLSSTHQIYVSGYGYGQYAYSSY